MTPAPETVVQRQLDAYNARDLEAFLAVFADDVKPGKVTSFPQAVKLKDDETVIFAWIVYKSRADRDRVNEKVMADPRLADMMDPENSLFDASRMFWGGFDVIVDV